MTMNNIDPVLRSDLERICEIFPHQLIHKPAFRAMQAKQSNT